MSGGETDHGNTATKVDGEVDASWSSDFKDRAVKSSPPPEDIEYATAPAEQQGDEAFEFLPDGVSRDDLTDLQAKVIKTAVLHNPDSFAEVGRIVGCTRQTAGNALKEYAPDLAEAVKMDDDEGAKRAGLASARANSDGDAVADGYGDATTYVHADHPAPKMKPRRVERAIEAAETVEEISENLEARKTARHIRRILEGGDGDE